MFQGGLYRPPFYFLKEEFNMNTKRGFTLIEIVIVIAIIAILASLSIPIYMKYQKKAKVSSYVLPIVKACAYDIAIVCQELKVKSNTNIDVSNIKNCQNITVPGGDLKISLTAVVECTPEGYISQGTVTGQLSDIKEYKARCTLNNQGIVCTVE
jgi:prepilin-type N-terminal cleavage/methylation domain-containing protein